MAARGRCASFLELQVFQALLGDEGRLGSSIVVATEAAAMAAAPIVVVIVAVRIRHNPGRGAEIVC